MGKNSRKRKREQLVEDARPDNTKLLNTGVASTLDNLRAQEISQPDQQTHNKVIHGQTNGEWITVGKSGKRQKQTTYPSLTYADLHRLQSSLKIVDLQNLVLYCIADGVSTSWVSVKHHANIKKAVVLFVPGLEKDMFDGSISLQESLSNTEKGKEDAQSGSAADSKTRQNWTSTVASRVANHKTAGYRKGNASLSPDDYMPIRLVRDSLPVSLRSLADIFVHLWPVKAPGDDKFSKVHSPLHAMLTAPIPKSREERRHENKIKGAKPAREGQYWENKRTPVAAFIASKQELLENEYTAHPTLFVGEEEQETLRRHAAGASPEAGWVDTLVDNLEDGNVSDKDIEQGSLTAGRTVMAMDCEMCKVEDGELALTRISIVGWDGEVVLDELVKPAKRIIDYLTRWAFLQAPKLLDCIQAKGVFSLSRYSGITAEKLAPISTTLRDIQNRLLELFTPQTIIIGHSLNSDMTALKLTHPFIVDTSILYQHPRGPPMKSSLKWLAQKYLGREIQKGHGTLGHDSVEDARACLDLVKMKCERGPKWGTAEAAGESIFKRLLRSSKAGTSTVNGTEGKRGAIVDHGVPEKTFGQMASYCIGCANDSEVVTGVKRAVLGDTDGSIIPGGGVEFTWARFRELENLRGWSNDNRHLPDSPTSSDGNAVGNDPSPAVLGASVAQTVQHIKSIRDFLPPCTLLVVYSGTGDPREMSRLQEMQKRFRTEYAVKKWDELSVQWTDTEEQALKRACRVAQEGLGFVGIV